MKNCSCPVCYEHQSANEYYRMTVHINAYHKLIEKIHEKIELLNKRKKIEDGEDIPFPESTETVKQILKSLLENEKL